MDYNHTIKVSCEEYKKKRKNQVKSDIIGVTNKMGKIREIILNVSKTDATVLITGETGSGKEVVATEVYKNSNRKNQPYIKVNCSAIPDSLLESELFGYEKGAFTGALQKEKLGLFEMANHGTILLDEIGEMPVNLQSKLLRVLQEKEIKRIGGSKSIIINVRVIAATNQNLKEQIEKGLFREDLYYRLNVIPIEIPPLRERKEDISILAYSFLENYNKKYDKNKKFQSNAIDILECYKWPGNIRELRNIVERLVIIGNENVIYGSDIANILGKNKSNDINNGANTTLKEAVNSLEKKIIEKALKKYGSTYKAAKVLGITQPTVLRKARALGIEKW